MRKTECYDRVWLQRIRAISGKTQSDVAAECGISTGYYNKLEGGISVPSIHLAYKLADVLRFDPKLFAVERKLSN